IVELKDINKVGGLSVKLAALLARALSGLPTNESAPRTFRGSVGLFPVCWEVGLVVVPPVVLLVVLDATLLEAEAGLASKETKALTFGLPKPVAKSYPEVAG